MPTPSIKTRFEFDNEREYKQAISEINSELRVLDSQMKLVSATYADNDRSVDALAASGRVLEQQLESQREKVDALRAALAFAAENSDGNSRSVNNWQVSLNKAEAELIKLQREE